MAAPQRKDDYQIGIICALAIEAAAMAAMLDETHAKLPKDKDDPNDYTFGRIGVHDIVIACLPAGSMGIGAAATVANNMQRSFPIKFGLLVGIAGGVWSKKADIRLGDVVVSQPTGRHGGVVQWDYGKTIKGGVFERTGSLDRPPPVLLQALQTLRIFSEGADLDLPGALEFMGKDKPKLAKNYRYQGGENDQLFIAAYDHIGDETCELCDKAMLVLRTPRDESTPEVHYGNIASGSKVMKHGLTRDLIAKEEDIICFEMEAAGLMNDFRCLVIRGICDYADSHKNDIWQRYAAATAAAFTRVLLGFIDKQKVIETPKPPKPLRVLPFGQNMNFVGRQSYLDRLIQIFCKDEAEQNCRRAALDGLGGVGKTQIALQFAFVLQKTSPAHSVFWVQASDPISFENSYRRIGEALGISAADDDKADVKNLVKQELEKESRGRWLLIIDNADDAQLFQVTDDTLPSLSEYLPYSNLGGILFTTRNHKVATDHAEAEVISIDMMDEAESEKLLRTSLQNKDILDNTQSVLMLLELLTNLPLAIKQAAAFINEKKSTIAQYISIYKSSNTDLINLLSKNFGDQWRYKGMKNPIATTWLISFKQVKQQDPLAATYMAFMSCIEGQGIPLSILPEASKFEQADAIGTLKGFGFLTERPSRDMYDMHRLVHIAMRNWLDLEQELELASRDTLERIANVFPRPEHENRDIWTVYLPHGQSVFALTKNLAGVEELHYWLLSRIGQCFNNTGRYRDGESLLRQALVLAAKLWGTEHPDTLSSMNNLAGLLESQGKYDEAEPIYQQTLVLTEKVLGTEHPNTLSSMNNLAGLLESQGKYDEAKPLYQQTLVLTEKVLGTEHPNTLSSMNNLASLLNRQGKYDKAKPLYQQTLVLREKVLGTEHPDTLSSMNNLASLLESQGKYDEAEPIYQQTLVLTEKVLGTEHPNTLTSMNNLAFLLNRQGKYDEAEPLFQQTLVLAEKVLGTEHPDTLSSMNNLAFLLNRQGKYDEAEPIYQQTLVLREKVLGTEHPDTLSSMNNLAFLLNRQGKYDEAEPIYQQTLVLREKVLGTEHPDTLSSMNNLASLLESQGKYDEAEPIYQQTLVLTEKVLGTEHPNTLTSMNNLAGLLESQGKYDEAKPLYQQTLVLREKVLGTEHPDTLSSMNNLAFLLNRQGKYDEAEPIFQQTMALREKVLGTKHPDTLKSVFNLASFLKRRGSINEAKTLFQEELSRCEMVYGPDHPETLSSRANLASISESFKEHS